MIKTIKQIKKETFPNKTIKEICTLLSSEGVFIHGRGFDRFVFTLDLMTKDHEIHQKYEGNSELNKRLRL